METFIKRGKKYKNIAIRTEWSYFLGDYFFF